MLNIYEEQSGLTKIDDVYLLRSKIKWMHYDINRQIKIQVNIGNLAENTISKLNFAS